jgi:dihydroorotase
MLINVMICWSPLEGETLPATIAKTFVNGHLAWDNGKIVGTKVGKRLGFERAGD